MAEQVVKCVDHLTVLASPAEPLFAALTGELLLPVAWALNTNPFYTSGGVHLGNLNLEIRQTRTTPHPAHLYGIAFESAAFEESLPALEKRGIPHTPPHPFTLFDDQGWQMTAWRSVYLGGLLGSTLLSRIFFAASQRISEDAWERLSLPTRANRRFIRPLIFDRIFSHGVVSTVAYNPAWKAYNIRQGAVYGGLELERVCELVIGVKNLEDARRRWANLLPAWPELSAGMWQSPEGLNLRLVEAPQDGFRGMVWQVKSLNRAAQFLHKRGLLGHEKEKHISIDPGRMAGLDVQLVQ
jgi:hypothetical protein